MTVKNKEQRVGIFIDIQNLYHSSKNLFGARVNYKELLKTLLGGRKLIRCMAYVVKTDLMTEQAEMTEAAQQGSTPEAAFFEALKRTGIELRIKDIQVFSSGMKKADWDVGMAVDAIRMADFLDVVILVTGDSDFVPLVEYLKWGMGREVEVAAFSRSAGAKIKEVADEFIPLEDIPKILIRRSNSRMRSEPRENSDNK